MSEEYSMLDNPPEPEAVQEPVVEQREPGQKQTAPEVEATQEPEDDFSDLAPKKLSGAQRQKLKIQRLLEENAALKAKSAEPRAVDSDDYRSEIEKVALELLERREREANEAKAFSQWQHRLEEGRAKYGDDFDEALEQAPSVRLEVLEIMRESEVGSDMAMFLATNPKEIERLNSLSPALAAREAARLESRFEAKKTAESKPKSKPASSAPPAIAPVSPSARIAVHAASEGYEVY